jgi:hypothetical protein
MIGIGRVVGTFAPVAQLDRASGFEPEGWGFESLRVYQPTNLDGPRITRMDANIRRNKLKVPNHGLSHGSEFG